MNLNRRTIAIASVLVLLVGAGSAALLSTYGTVDGTAEVQQAVTLDSQTDNTPVDYSFAGDQTAGETVVETHTLHNNANVSASVSFTNYCEKGSDTITGSATQEDGAYVDWAGTNNCEGIETTHVEYFDNAGHDFSDYEAPANSGTGDNVLVVGDSSNDADDYDTIQAAVNNAGTNTVVLVKQGTYDEDVTLDHSGMTLAAGSLHEARVNGTVTVTADQVTVEGLEITNPDGNEGSTRGVMIQDGTSDVHVQYNDIHNIRATSRAVGVQMYSSDGTVDNPTVANNYIHDVTTTTLSGTGGWTKSKSKGVHADGDVDSPSVIYNTFENVGGSTSYHTNGVVISRNLGQDAVVSNPYPQDFNVSYNTFSGMENNVETAGYTPTTVYVPSYESSDSYGEEEISHNNFLTDNTRDVEELGSSSDTLQATDNFFGSDGIVTDGDVNAQWKTKTDLTLEAGTSDEFGVVNSFAINLVPDSYTIATDIVPTGTGVESTPS